MRGRWGDGDGDGRGGDAIRIDIFTVSVTDRLGVIFSYYSYKNRVTGKLSAFDSFF